MEHPSLALALALAAIWRGIWDSILAKNSLQTQNDKVEHIFLTRKLLIFFGPMTNRLHPPLQRSNSCKLRQIITHSIRSNSTIYNQKIRKIQNNTSIKLDKTWNYHSVTWYRFKLIMESAWDDNPSIPSQALTSNELHCLISRELPISSIQFCDV